MTISVNLAKCWQECSGVFLLVVATGAGFVQLCSCALVTNTMCNTNILLEKYIARSWYGSYNDGWLYFFEATFCLHSV